MLTGILNPDFKLSSTYQDSDCPIAAIEYKPFNMDNYIRFNDYIEYISENKERLTEKLSYIKSGITFNQVIGTGTYVKDNGYVFPVQDNKDYYQLRSNSFLVTDIVSPYIKELPLFYQHRLQYDMYCEQQNPEKYIKIRQNGNILVDEDTYILQYGNASLTLSGNLYRDDITWTQTKPAGNNFRCRILLPYDPDYKKFYDIEYNAYINSAPQPRVELINRSGIYQEGLHYNRSTSGIVVLTATGVYNITPSGYLYLQKRYDSRIFFKPFDELLYTSGTTPWYPVLNPGNFIQLSGMTNTSTLNFIISNPDSGYIYSGEYPKIYNNNVLKTTKFPIYTPNNGYPTYGILSGISVYINNEKLESKYIQSIDNEKGFIQLKKAISTTDNVYINYDVNSRENYILKSTDINPKNFTQFKVLNDGISFVIIPTGNPVLYFRTIDNPKGDFVNIPTYGWGVNVTGIISTTSGLINSSGILLGEVTYKSQPTDIITFTDCRRLGGGLKPSENSDEQEWYYDRGNWDGEVLQSNAAVVIQIPSGIFNYFIGKFYDYGSFSAENYNEQILLGNDPSGVLQELGFNDLKYYNAVKEANKYINDTIKKYIPVGTEYVIMDNSFKIMDLII